MYILPVQTFDFGSTSLEHNNLFDRTHEGIIITSFFPNEIVPQTEMELNKGSSQGREDARRLNTTPSLIIYRQQENLVGGPNSM